MQVFVENPNTIVIDVDQGRQGRGISNITYTEVSGQYFLIVTYTDGTTETLGPLVVTGGAAFLLGGTTGALPYQSAPNTTTFLPLGTSNQVVVAGASAPQYTSNLTGLTVNNTPVGNTTPSTGAFTNLSASGTFALTGDQVQISEGGTGQTTANAAFNALAPSQTGNAGKYLKTDGTNSAWDQLDISTADITGTLPIANGGTGQTTANSALNALLPTQVAQSGKYLKTDGTNASWDQLDISTADITGVLPVANGGTGASTAPGARANLSAAVLGTNNDITSMTGVTGGISSPDFVQFDTTAAATNAVGKVYWDAAQGTLDVGLLGGNVITRIGQTLVAFVTNAEATTITKGQVVYLFGAQGDRATVKLAYNTSDATSAKTFGVVAENIGPNQTGFVMCQGVLEGLNLGAFTAGDTLYLGATPGSLTATKPAAPNHLVYVGLVERANPGNGQLYVKVQNGYELDEIHDVQIITPQNGQTLIYDATTSLWKNANLTAGSGISVTNGAASITVSNTGVLSFSGGTTGLTPATSTTGVVTLGGTLNVANGGTGATTASGARTNLGLGTISTQDANSVTITGGSINNTTVGASTPSTGAFTSVAMTSGTVSTTPASATDIANKQYVDTLVSSGITYHAPVKYEVPSTTGNLNATYNNGTAGVGATLTNAGTLAAFTPDGVVAQAGDRILIYNQTNAAQNGVYVVTTVGSGSVAWVLTRASDADTYALKSPNSLGEGDAFFIQSGNTGAGETYVCNTQGTITFGTTPITFVQVSASQVYSAGTGLTLSGTQFSITNTAVTPNSYGSASAVGTFTVNQQGQLTLAATTPIAIANTQVSGLGTMSTQNANSVAITGGSIDGTIIGGTTRAAGLFTTLTLTNALGIANGGTGQTTANAAFNALAPSQTGNAGKYLTTDGTNTSWATNPLGTVTSVDVSGGTTGLTTSGGPITSSGTITLGGTLATTNGGTGLTSFTANRVFYSSSTSAIGSSANLTFDGTTLTANALTTTSTVTINGGTANGVAYLDGSKVLTTGSALTFNGTTFTQTAAAPVFSITESTSGNFNRINISQSGTESRYNSTFTSGSGQHVWQIGNAEQMRLTSIGLGIGTSSPVNRQSIQTASTAGIAIALNLNNPRNYGAGTGLAGAGIRFNRSPSDAGSTGVLADVYGVSESETSSTAGALVFATRTGASEATTERMRVTSAGNVGIATTSPGALLDVAGLARTGGDATFRGDVVIRQNTNTISGNGGLELKADGNASGYGARIQSIFNGTSAYDLSFQLRNNSATWTQRMLLDSSGNLLVNAGGKICGNATSGSTSSTIELYNASTGSMNFVTGFSTANITFTTNGSERLRLDSSGNLGLGVTPSAWSSSIRALQLYGGRAALASDGTSTWLSNNWYNDGADKYVATAAVTVYRQASGSHQWFNAPSGTAGNTISFTQAMTLDASGNLVVGDTSAAAKLDIVSTQQVAIFGSKVAQNAYTAWRYNSTTLGYVGNGSGVNAGSGATDFAIGSTGSRALTFGTNDTERARITSGGDLLVGTTSVFASSKITVSSADKGVGVQITGTSKQSIFGLYIGKPDNDTTTSQRFIGFSVNNDVAGSGQINANGAGAAAFGSFSDARLKENIVDLEPQLAKVLALRPVEFDYKDGSGHQTGFIAQEMQSVYPDAVGEQDGLLTITGYGKTEARLIKAIQEQQALINDLRVRVAQLEAK